MIKNIIIIALVIFVFTKMDVSTEQVVDAMQSGLDKLQELLYIMKEKV
jgi:hypothetical protein